MINIQKLKGVSLLEAMLFLVIIALISMMVMRYFNQANDGQRINTAISMVQKVHNLTQRYVQSYNYKLSNISGNSSENNAVTYYQDQGLLPDLYDKNPWNGDIIATMGNDNILTITLTKVPAILCARMLGRMNQTISNSNDKYADKYTCGGSGGSHSYSGGSTPSIPSGVDPSKIPAGASGKTGNVTFTAKVKIN